MRCKIKKMELSAWLLGHLSQQDATVIERHVSSCRYCQSEVAALKASMNHLQVCREISMPLGLKQRILARAAASTQPTADDWLTWRKGWPVLAALAMMLAGAMGWWQQSREAEQALIRSYAEDFNVFFNSMDQTSYLNNSHSIYGIPNEVIDFLN